MTSVHRFNRRRLLLGLAAASTAAAAASATTASVSAADAEVPELLALADRLPAAAQEYRDALAALDAIAAEWGPQWPTPDDRIIGWSGGSKEERDILGQGIQRPWGNSGLERMHHIGNSECFEADAEGHERRIAHIMTTKSRRGLRYHTLHAQRSREAVEPARRYWAEVERITEASGVEAAQTRLRDARDALQHLVGRIVTFDERTAAGLVIKAQALQEWEAVERFYRALNPETLAWSEAFVASVMRRTAAS